MMVDHSIQHEQNISLYTYILATTHGIVYMYQAPIVVDSCAKYEQNQPFLFRDITTNLNTENV